MAGSLQDRKESENDTFCGSRSGSRRSDHGDLCGITGESGAVKEYKGDMRDI